jgi:N-methylhydantoinase B/oxoprolinase/acetone carboxylase alpha subunit
MRAACWKHARWDLRIHGFLDDNGIEQVIPIRASITISSDKALIDFTGSAPQQIAV